MALKAGAAIVDYTAMQSYKPVALGWRQIGRNFLVVVR
jgi:hypothetical protein